MSKFKAPNLTKPTFSLSFQNKWLPLRHIYKYLYDTIVFCYSGVVRMDVRHG